MISVEQIRDVFHGRSLILVSSKASACFSFAFNLIMSRGPFESVLALSFVRELLFSAIAEERCEEVGGVTM